MIWAKVMELANYYAHNVIAIFMEFTDNGTTQLFVLGDVHVWLESEFILAIFSTKHHTTVVFP